MCKLKYIASNIMTIAVAIHVIQLVINFLKLDIKSTYTYIQYYYMHACTHIHIHKLTFSINDASIASLDTRAPVQLYFKSNHPISCNY